MTLYTKTPTTTDNVKTALLHHYVEGFMYLRPTTPQVFVSDPQKPRKPHPSKQQKKTGTPRFFIYSDAAVSEPRAPLGWPVWKPFLNRLGRDLR